MQGDRTDELVAQWKGERPDLDLAVMATFARFGRLYRTFTAQVEGVLHEHGLQLGEFDVLATLRRAGEPYRLHPKDLNGALMISSGAMTNRLDRLEQAGLIERSPDPGDRRAILVGLTQKGYELVDAAVGDHVANEARLLAPLGEREIDQFNRLMTKLLAPHER